MSPSPAECPVCLGDMLPGSWVELECGHKFHGQCAIDSLWKCGVRCPVCRNTSSHFEAQTSSHDHVEVYPASEDDEEDDAYDRAQQETLDIKKEIARRLRMGDKRVRRSQECMDKWKQRYTDSNKDVKRMRKALVKKRKLWVKQFKEDHKAELKSYNAARSQSNKQFSKYVDIKKRLDDKIKRELRARGEADRHDSQDTIDDEEAMRDVWNDMRTRAYAWLDHANAAAD